MERMIKWWLTLHVSTRAIMVENVSTTFFIMGLITPMFCGILGKVMDITPIIVFGILLGIALEVIMAILQIWGNLLVHCDDIQTSMKSKRE